ncbi:hypothetical protein FY534_10380 [Alicyclobacillus sp. TC]|uniref:hypothetical protein n=1 Tax=Alicyclobacillus sp. TC TaxID=2606450 RepID=UPI001933F794|nr:hypothetical protein [Alicyclobacillus sp. TC]QRF23998.1 hypothetical protein FY534_10380 [Alicyclobacillus sp. TC]
MVKRNKLKSASTVNHRDEWKPDYAMDKMEPVAKPKKNVIPEENARLEEFLSAAVAEKLSALKMTEKPDEDTALRISDKSKKEKQIQTRSAKEKLEENPDATFAELFDPAEDDHQSFEELLKDSALDWRHFKQGGES